MLPASLRIGRRPWDRLCAWDSALRWLARAKLRQEQPFGKPRGPIAVLRVATPRVGKVAFEPRLHVAPVAAIAEGSTGFCFSAAMVERGAEARARFRNPCFWSGSSDLRLFAKRQRGGLPTRQVSGSGPRSLCQLPLRVVQVQRLRNHLHGYLRPSGQGRRCPERHPDQPTPQTGLPQRGQSSSRSSSGAPQCATVPRNWSVACGHRCAPPFGRFGHDLRAKLTQMQCIVARSMSCCKIQHSLRGAHQGCDNCPCTSCEVAPQWRIARVPVAPFALAGRHAKPAPANADAVLPVGCGQRRQVSICNLHAARLIKAADRFRITPPEWP